MRCLQGPISFVRGYVWIFCFACLKVRNKSFQKSIGSGGFALQAFALEAKLGHRPIRKMGPQKFHFFVKILTLGSALISLQTHPPLKRMKQFVVFTHIDNFSIFATTFDKLLNIQFSYQQLHTSSLAVPLHILQYSGS